MKLTSKDWNDIADLLWQFEMNCESSYENHTRAARDYLRKELAKQSLKAQEKANQLEEKEKKWKKQT